MIMTAAMDELDIRDSKKMRKTRAGMIQPYETDCPARVGNLTSPDIDMSIPRAEVVNGRKTFIPLGNFRFPPSYQCPH
jgi:hypothetical protein